MDATIEALSLFYELIENDTLWKRFNQSFDDMAKLSKYISTSTGLFFGQLKTDMLDGLDGYFHASIKIYEWSSLIESYMKLYIKLFDDHDAQRAKAQNMLSIKMLEKGVTQMIAAIAELGESYANFKSVRNKLLARRSKFGPQSAVEFAESLISEKYLTANEDDRQMIRNGILTFYTSVWKKANQTKQNIIDAKKILRTGIHLISVSKAQVQQTVPFVVRDETSDLRDMIINAAQRLIAKCEEYRKRHNNTTQLN